MITVKINSIDRTALIDWPTFVWEQALTSQVDTVRFTIKRYDTKTYKPALLDDVEVLDGATKLFGGKIVHSREAIEGRLQLFEVMVKDHTHEMDKRLVVKTYEDTTVSVIINDIKALFLPAGFTTTGVTVTTPVKFIAFNYEQPSKCFQQLAELVGADWYVDENKDIKFFLRNEMVAPFDLTDTNGKYIFNSLVIERDVVNLRNVIFVRGGEFKGTTFTEKETADGVAKVFKQGFRYSAISPATAISVKKGGVAQSVGTDNIHDPAAFDVLYNFQEKAVKFRDDNKPANGVEVEVTGLPHIPVIIRTRDNVSAGTFGEFEHKIIDKSIDSKEGARDRARGELIAWADKINEGGFTTVESGLRAGQKIRIQSTIRGLDETFVISRVSSKLMTPTDLEHRATLMTQRTFGMVEFLTQLLMRKDKEIEINRDEVLDRIEAAIEDIIVTEAFTVVTAHNAQLESIAAGETPTVQALNYPVVFVLAPYPVPTGFNRELALGGLPFGGGVLS